MSLERELDRIDRRIRGVRDAIDVAYATRVPDERKDVLFQRLDCLEGERERRRRDWKLDAAFDRLRTEISQIWRRLTEKIAPLLDELSRLDRERERSRPAFWRGVAGRGARFDAPGRVALAGALSANRRPVLPGYMKQKGRG